MNKPIEFIGQKLRNLHIHAKDRARRDLKIRMRRWLSPIFSTVIIKGASAYQRRNERTKWDFVLSIGSTLCLFGDSTLIATYARNVAASIASQNPLPGDRGGGF